MTGQEGAALQAMISIRGIQHIRLEQLYLIADMCQPLYEWVESKFQAVLGNSASLHENLMTGTREEITRCMTYCYERRTELDIADGPILYNGVGEPYTKIESLHKFLGWLPRDAPDQRLTPLLRQVVRSLPQKTVDYKVRAGAYATLIEEYRSVIKNFTWEAMREVLVDRLEGSRRAGKAHRIEAGIRRSVAEILESTEETRSANLAYDRARVEPTEIRLGGETYDIAVSFRSKGVVQQWLLMPVKTRETQGGGHGTLFERELRPPVRAAKQLSPPAFVVLVAIAGNWPVEKARQICDWVVHLSGDTGSNTELSTEQLGELRQILEATYCGEIEPKSLADVFPQVGV